MGWDSFLLLLVDDPYIWNMCLWLCPHCVCHYILFSAVRTHHKFLLRSWRQKILPLQCLLSLTHLLYKLLALSISGWRAIVILLWVGIQAGGHLGGLVPVFTIHITLKLDRFSFFISYGVVWTWSCATSWSFTHYPHMGLPMGQKLVKSGTNGVQICGQHISETAGWISPFQSSMESSKRVVEQHYVHLPICFICTFPYRTECIWRDFLHSKFYGNALTCNCATSWSFAHFTHLGLPIWSIWTWPWAGIYISETARLSVQCSMEMSRLIVMQRHGYLPILTHITKLESKRPKIFNFISLNLHHH